ncbi:hypothetical protein like AT4G35690 [Hibiscus trionum]|uniref:Uncharacterized protein n=1 Tax=Hibiscus trionum TaxID=183268 RepID=A0A9W7GYA3_HIBTR|nr:hypothetical protein like AT4G35690 [Hibiscus trionum]
MGGRYHVRSISLPSRSHPTTLRIEDELNRLKTWEASSSPLSTCESISASLSGLENLYECVDDLLNMPSTRQVLSKHQHEKCVDEMLDGSVRLLDICGIARDNMFELKEHVHAFQSGLRRRSIENNILNYTKFRKELNKRGKRLITQLKKMEASAALMEQEHHFSAGVISCEENANELESVDAALYRHTSDVEKMQIALVALESGIEGLEKRLESVFRQLIKARTTLLNIISL